MDIFQKALNNVVIFDGAMGTQLQEKGMKTGECPEYLNISQPEMIYDIHLSYLEAGADIIETNTFGANRIKLKAYNMSEDVSFIIAKAVSIAKRASNGKPVALSIGPIGELMKPYGKLTFEEAYDVFKEVAIAGEISGADIALIETMSDILEAKAAILAVKENTNLKIICTMTFQEDGRTLMGSDPVTAIISLQGLSLDAVGVNCSTGPDKMIDVVRKMSKVAHIPIIAQPNAGMPYIKDGKTVYNVSPEEFAKYSKKLVENGASIVGGCCGTTPEHIKKLKEYVKDIKLLRNTNIYTAVSSNTKTVFIGGSNPICIIGERINPTGKKKLSAAIKEGDINLVIEEAMAQQKAGSNVLDVNIGVPGINEEKMMPLIVSEIQNVSDLPLQIDSNDIKAIEKAVRIIRGKPIINSVNAQEKSLREVLPIVKKYGTCVIGLAMGNEGLPKNAEDRLENAKKIIKAALKIGIPKEDIIIDCIALTVSSEQTAAMETLKAIKLIKSELHVNTTIGLSNVSYGLPEGKFINSAFLAMAVSYGLDAVILNPNNDLTMDILHASMVLTAKDKRCENYIKRFKKEDNSHISSPHYDDTDKPQLLYKNILEGKKSDIDKLVLDILSKEAEPLNIIDNIVIPALKEVGDRYDKGVYFLPQLLSSAEVVQRAFKIIKDKLPRGTESRGKIILATVEGDIHDIGKNIVKVLLESYGYEVIDLGKDVKAEVILEKVKEINPLLVGLSALMTTTLFNMEKTIKILRQSSKVKIMVGGAALTEEYAYKIGADFYGANAQDAVRIADEVLKAKYL
ncbi:homocysteine S-methyltransferase family protein [Aceticella autotrophica]|uniref:Methionine synthase n=1 Tax=Aceticella autotrophica TaxID=2755338 RepID=A0A975AWH6_9THEO|nr:homocysteine S-methyltransferase family protein [Aceticella autotrophica]QSZ27737.1 homocysteine S-methyltransferase family protein [Aceticella autotrophica]